MTVENKITPPSNFDAKDTAKHRKQLNPVHVLRNRVENAFSADAYERPTANDDCINVIDRFLSLIDWSQGKRRIFESMPHADTMETLAAFRSVLFRLGFKQA